MSKHTLEGITMKTSLLIAGAFLLLSSATGNAQSTQAIYLDAESHGRHNLITWKTADTIKSGEFIVYRSSNQNRWTKIGSVHGDPGSNSQGNFFFWDKVRKKQGMCYYKVEFLEKDREMVASRTVQVHRLDPELAHFHIYPIPVHHSFHINLKKHELKWAEFNALLINTEGQVIWQQAFVSRHNRISLKNITPGVYRLELWAPDEVTRVSENIVVR